MGAGISVRCLRSAAAIDGSIDEDVERHKLSILHPSHVGASDDAGSAGASVLPGNASNAEVFLNRRGNRIDDAWKLVLERGDSGTELFRSLMDSSGIDEDPVLDRKSVV